MRWEETLLDLFEDLEQQAEGLALAERDLEVAELSRAEYAQVTLADRLHGSTGCPVTLSVLGVGPVAGVLARVGDGWCLLGSGGRDAGLAAQEWIVSSGAVLGVAGLSERALHTEQRPLSTRLGLGSALRAVAAERGPVRLHARDGSVRRGALGRVGADFVELVTSDEPPDPAGRATGQRQVLPFAALAAVRRC